MHDLVDRAAGEHLTGQDYLDDFALRFGRISTPGFWKLERRQTFREPRSESWRAFDRGEWDLALRLLEERRLAIAAEERDLVERGVPNGWVRVVEHPISPYLRWEFHSLRLRNEYAGTIRVVRADDLRRFEERGPLPEVVTLDTDVMYDLVYDESGLQDGGVRITDPERVACWQRFIEDLYRDAEDVESFFRREVAPLGPPGVG
ncbi:DUF6879 family protein [Actinosynnema sp. NPDC059797]